MSLQSLYICRRVLILCYSGATERAGAGYVLYTALVVSVVSFVVVIVIT